MILIPKSCLQKQLIRILGVNFIFNNTEIVVKNPIALFQSVLANNAKMKKKRNTLSRWKSSVKFFN